jgi:hypothetical protein
MRKDNFSASLHIDISSKDFKVEENATQIYFSKTV